VSSHASSFLLRQDLSAAASYQYVMEKVQRILRTGDLAALRATRFHHAPFNRSPAEAIRLGRSRQPDHTPELHADIARMASALENREAAWQAQPWPVEPQPVPLGLEALFNGPHSLSLGWRTPAHQASAVYREPYTEVTSGEHGRQSQAAEYLEPTILLKLVPLGRHRVDRAALC